MKLKLRAQKGDDTEHLKALLKLLDELSSRKGNEWFLAALKSKYSHVDNGAHNTTNELSEVYDDLRRTKYYLKNIDKKFRLEGFNFYKSVSESIIKKELINDYKEMKIAFINTDYLEYGRRMSLQLERCFDFVINKLNAWDIVKNNSTYTEISIPSGTFDERVKISENFYKKDFNSPNNDIKKEISEINFKSKAAFCALHYSIELKYIWSNLNDIYFLRNKASHSTLSTKDQKKLQKISEDFLEKNGFYHKMFTAFISPLKALYI